MKRNRIWVIIIFMSTALLGIILVQVYWINNTIAQKEKIFDFQVNDALNKVADKMESKMVASVLGDQFISMFPDSAYWQNNDTVITIDDVLNDSTMTKVFKSTKKGDNYYEEREIRISAYAPIADPMPGIPDRPTMVLEPFEYEGLANTDPNSPDNNLIPELLKNMDKQFQLNADKINKVMRQMMIQMMDMGINPEENIDTKYLEKTLQNELINKGITTNFNYAVLANKSLISNKHDTLSQNELIHSKHKVNLFPNEMFNTSDILMVYFPNQTNYFLSSIWSLLLGSLIFTAIIIIGFSYTIHIIFRQKKLSEIKTDFINNMTHEFKTPLATISLAVDAINNPMILRDETKVQHYTHIIKEENKRMNGQVEKVLQMALLDRKQISLSAEDIDMHYIISRAVENISLQVQENGGEITTELYAENFEIVSDEVHMMNVISNLLDNANKYSPEKPEIKVSTYSDKKGLYITVTDKGMGMLPEQQKMVFEKFYRVPTGNVHNIKGFGLGLAYVKAILDAQGGTIEIKSNLHKGSEFKIFLPFTN